jgi:hypothetical protein
VKEQFVKPCSSWCGSLHSSLLNANLPGFENNFGNGKCCVEKSWGIKDFL